jgi:hypothetical protein
MTRIGRKNLPQIHEEAVNSDIRRRAAITRALYCKL